MWVLAGTIWFLKYCLRPKNQVVKFRFVVVQRLARMDPAKVWTSSMTKGQKDVTRVLTEG